MIFLFLCRRIYAIMLLRIAMGKRKHKKQEGYAVQNKVTVTIDGQEYNLVAAEDAAYMRKVAAHVDAKIQEVSESGKIASADAVVLAALNMADEYFKSLEAAEALRAQIKGYLEEAKALNDQLSEAKREIFKLQSQKK